MSERRAKSFQHVCEVIEEVFLACFQSSGKTFAALCAVDAALLFSVFPVGEGPLGFGEVAVSGLGVGEFFCLTTDEEEREE